MNPAQQPSRHEPAQAGGGEAIPPRLPAAVVTARHIALYNAKRTAEAAPIAAELRRLVDAGETVAGAARIIGIHRERAKSIAQRFGIKATAQSVVAARVTRDRTGQTGPNDHLAPRLRKLVEDGMPVRTAGAQLGLSAPQSKRLAEKFGIKADAAALRALRSASLLRGVETRQAQAKPATRKPRLRAKEERRSHKVGLTEAQQQNIIAHKTRCWSAAVRLPPVTEEEAARLVAEFIEKRGVTKCPPAAEVTHPINGGMGWR